MNRMMTQEFENVARRLMATGAVNDPVYKAVGPFLAELDASREVETALLKALKETSQACAAMMRTIVKVCEPDMVDFITFPASEYDGFGARANAAIRMAETPEGYAAYKGAGTELDSDMPWCDHCVSYHHVTCPHIKWPNGGRCSIQDCGVCRLQAQETAHAREVEDVCNACGARTFSGICSAKCGS